MVEHNEIKNSKFSSVEEMTYLEIDSHLKAYETKLESLFKEKNYYKIIMDGTDIIELMLQHILTNENNPPKKPTTIKQAIKTNLIPIKVKNTLFEIDQINNEIDEENVNYKKTHKFLKSFKKFILWFNSTNDETNKFIIDDCSKLIEALPNNEPVKNNGKEEKDKINTINETLKNFEKYLKLVSKENYAGAVIEGYTVCSLMLELFLKNEGYEIDNGSVIKDDAEKIPIIPFCTQESMFSKECLAFLNTIEKYKNNFCKLSDSYDLALSFLEGLSYFLVWFNNSYSEKYFLDKPFKVENCCVEISKLTYQQNDAEIIFKSSSSNTKKQKSEIDNSLNGLPVSFPNNANNLDLQQMFMALSEDMKAFMDEKFQVTTKVVEESKETILSELGKIKEEIENISLKITDYQSLMERQINNFDSDEERDMLIAAFADECAERIIRETNFDREEDSYNLEKSNLIKSLGEKAWAKLSEDSQTYLISSKLMLNNLKKMGKVDYSGVCILVTKALEVELYKRFFDNFLNYLDRKHFKKYEKYPTGLLYKNKWPLNEDKFNLGTVAYIFCIKGPNDYYLERNNKEKLMEYCEADLFNEYETEKIENLITKFGTTIEEIRKNYRNPSAHRKKISQDNAEECLELVLYKENNPLLKEMLDSFKK